MTELDRLINKLIASDEFEFAKDAWTSPETMEEVIALAVDSWGDWVGDIMVLLSPIDREALDARKPELKAYLLEKADEFIGHMSQKEGAEWLATHPHFLEGFIYDWFFQTKQGSGAGHPQTVAVDTAFADVFHEAIGLITENRAEEIEDSYPKLQTIWDVQAIMVKVREQLLSRSMRPKDILLAFQEAVCSVDWSPVGQRPSFCKTL